MRLLLTIAGLLILNVGQVAAVGAHTFNFEFTNDQSSTSDDFALSAPGGTHWNKIGSAFFVDGTYDGGGAGTRNEFGVVPYPVGPNDPSLNALKQIQARRGGFSSAVTANYNVSGPLGSLYLSPPAPVPQGQTLNLLEIIGAQQGRKYDIAVYLDGRVGTPLSIALGTMDGVPLVAGVSENVFVGGRSFIQTRFDDVEPWEMHIGPPGTWPLGWGILVQPTSGPSPVFLGIAGVQIQEVVPEPNSVALIVAGLILPALRRRRRAYIPRRALR